MADEYSDEEFAADDGDGAAYEAEFDAEEEEAEEEEEQQHDTPLPREDARSVEETESDGGRHAQGVAKEAASGDGDAEEEEEEEEEDAYQESFDGDAEPEHDGGAAGAAVEKATDEAEQEEDQYEETESYSPDAADWREADTTAQAESHTAAEEEETKMEIQKPMTTSSAECVLEPQSSPLAASEDVATPVAATSAAPSPGRARSSSLSQIAELPHIELCRDPEVQAKLTRRSSSPRMRPAPMKRLASLGESGVATIEALLVPTNEVTEEAAAVVSAAAPINASASLVKRPSATFVPRLPSLMEFAPPQIIDGDSTREGARSRGARADTPETADDDKDEDEGEEEEEEEEEKEKEKEEEEDQEDEKNDQTNAVEEAEMDSAASRKDDEAEEKLTGKADEDEERLRNREADDDITREESEGTEPADGDATAVVVAAFGELHASENEDDSSPKIQHGDSGVGGEVTFAGESDGDTEVDDDELEAPDPEPASHLSHMCGDDGDMRLPEPAPPSQRPVDDPPQDMMQRLMADVEYQDDVNLVDDAIDEDAGDDAEFAVDAEDGDRRETRQLLHEVQMIITKQKEQVRGESPPDPTGYDDDDAFVDDDPGYEDVGGDEDGDTTQPSVVQYDSDYEELGIEEDDTEELREVEGTPAQSATSSGASALTPNETEDAVRADTPTDARETLPEEGTVSEERSSPATEVEGRADGPKSSTTASPPKDVALERTKVPQSPQPTTKQMSTAPRTTTPAAARRAFRPVPTPPNQEANSGAKLQGSPRKAVKPPVEQAPQPAPRKPEVPKFTPRAPVPRQQQPPTTTAATPPTHEISKEAGEQSVNIPPPTQQSDSPRPVSPAKSINGGARPSSPVRAAPQALPKSPTTPLSRKAPVFKQKKVPKATSPDSKNKRLKPVKCPLNLRVDIASHMDREKREWLLLNMFRHGDDVAKYEAFIPTSAVHQHMSAAIAGVDLAMSEAKRPLSARQIYGEPPANQASRGTYSRHGGRKLVARPVDPRLKERESNWVSIKSSESSIPAYDSILDKHCKTVTSPVVQRRIYETREYDLSPQLALVLEKRAFKEWKHGETESGLGSVSKSYKTAVVPPSASMKSLHPARPASSSSSTSTLPPPHATATTGDSTVVFNPEASS